MDNHTPTYIVFSNVHKLSVKAVEAPSESTYTLGPFKVVCPLYSTGISDDFRANFPANVYHTNLREVSPVDHPGCAFAGQLDCTPSEVRQLNTYAVLIRSCDHTIVDYFPTCRRHIFPLLKFLDNIACYLEGKPYHPDMIITPLPSDGPTSAPHYGANLPATPPQPAPPPLAFITHLFALQQKGLI